MKKELRDDRINVRATFSMKNNMNFIKIMLENMYGKQLSDSEVIEWLIDLGTDIMISNNSVNHFQ